MLLILYCISGLVSQNIYPKYKIYAYKSHSYRNNFFWLRFRTENRIVKDLFSNYVFYAGCLLKICSERWNKILNICTCNIIAMCTEMTDSYDGIIGL